MPAMWGAVVGITAASIALAVLHQTLEGRSEQAAKNKRPRELAPGDPSARKTPASGIIKAPLWQSGTAQEALKRAKRLFK